MRQDGTRRRFHPNVRQMTGSPAQDDYADLLRRSGRRVTNARLSVMAALGTAEGHLTASQVIESVQQQGSHVDQSTIYRALSDLRDAGMVAESRFGPGEATFEWIVESHHHHLHCDVCGRTEQLDGETVTRFTVAVRERHGFSVDARHMVLSGVCRDCANAAESGDGSALAPAVSKLEAEVQEMVDAADAPGIVLT